MFVEVTILAHLSRTHFLLPHVVYKLRIGYFGGIDHQSSHDRWSASIYNRFVEKQCTKNTNDRIFLLLVVWLNARVEIANLTVPISATHLNKFYFYVVNFYYLLLKGIYVEFVLFFLYIPDF